MCFDCIPQAVKTINMFSLQVYINDHVLVSFFVVVVAFVCVRVHVCVL